MPIRVLRVFGFILPIVFSACGGGDSGREEEPGPDLPGGVKGWGANKSGQLGDGTTDSRSVPVSVFGLEKVESIAGGDYHSVALLEDGTVWTWGSNAHGQLGDGTTVDRAVPAKVPGLTKVDRIACGIMHTLALLEDGSVRSWGGNAVGQLGDGTVADRLTPVEVGGLSSVADIAAFGGRSGAVLADGNVLLWGDPPYGSAIPEDPLPPPLPPTLVAGISGATSIAIGGGHYIVRRNDGSAWSWGKNHVGQAGQPAVKYLPNLGIWIGEDVGTPAPVNGLPSIAAIAAGREFSLALSATGKLYAWGFNGVGQLGLGSDVWASFEPVPLAELNGVAAVAAGYDNAMALLGDGSVWVWGPNEVGQLARGYFYGETAKAPVKVAGMGGVKKLGAGTSQFFAVR